MELTDTTGVLARLRSAFGGQSLAGAEYGRILLGKAAYLDAFVERRPFPPFEIEVQMSSKCNLQCRWCIGEEIQAKLCDHNTMPGAIPLGQAINQPLGKIWESMRRRYLVDGVRYVCQSRVCPPFGNAANFVLREVRQLADSIGSRPVTEALHLLRREATGSSSAQATTEAGTTTPEIASPARR